MAESEWTVARSARTTWAMRLERSARRTESQTVLREITNNTPLIKRLEDESLSVSQAAVRGCSYNAHIKRAKL